MEEDLISPSADDRPALAADTPYPSPTSSPNVPARTPRPLRPPPPSIPNGKKAKSLPREPDGVEWEVRTRRMDPLTLNDCWGNAYDLTRRILSPVISEKSDVETLTRASSMSLRSLWSNVSVGGDDLESLKAAANDDVDDELDKPRSRVEKGEKGRFRSVLPYHVSVTALTGAGAVEEGSPSSSVSSLSETSDTMDEREDWERDIAAWRKGQRSQQAQRKMLLEGAQPARETPSPPLASPHSLKTPSVALSDASNDTTVSETSGPKTRPPSRCSSVRVRLANSEGPDGPVSRRSSALLFSKREDRAGGKTLRRVDRRNKLTLEQLREAEERYRRSIVQSEEASEREAVRPVHRSERGSVAQQLTDLFQIVILATVPPG
jgi:hypothetical protein